jgi:hypothetical protein
MTIPYAKIANKGPGLKKGGSVKKYKGGGMATKGLGKAFKKQQEIDHGKKADSTRHRKTY